MSVEEELVPLTEEELFGDNHDENADSIEDKENTAPKSGDEEELSADVLEKLKKLGKASKHQVTKPQPKLNSDKLLSDRGLPALQKACSKLKFKGKHHEKEDLNLLMSTLEHWAHRLFPKMTFDEVIERCERLGQKRPIQTYMQKVKLGVIENCTDPDDNNNDDDTMNRSSTDIDNDNLFNSAVIHDNKNDDNYPDLSDLFGSDKSAPKHNVEIDDHDADIDIDELTFSNNYDAPNEDPEELFNAKMLKECPEILAQIPSTEQNHGESPSKTTKQKSGTEATTNILTEEQLAVIEKNRLAALERRNKLKRKREETESSI